MTAIFVRIPTRPAHRSEPGAPSGSLLDFARDGALLCLERLAGICSTRDATGGEPRRH